MFSFVLNRPINFGSQVEGLVTVGYSRHTVLLEQYAVQEKI
jgi:hypothetical protein